MVITHCRNTVALALSGALAAAIWGTPGAVRSEPARQCIAPAPADLQSLRDDRLRLVAAIKAFTPGVPPDGRLVVSMLVGDPPVAHELARIALYPPQPFKATQPERTQRFLLSSAHFSRWIKESGPVCLEVRPGTRGLQGSQTARVEFGIELAPVRPP